MSKFQPFSTSFKAPWSSIDWAISCLTGLADVGLAGKNVYAGLSPW
jgi:hypothetical protein